MKRLSFINLLAFSVFSLISCSANKHLELVMAESNPPDTISAKTDKIFAEKVEELSEGKIKIQLFTDSLLGNNDTVLSEMVKDKPNIHLASVSPDAMVDYDCTETSLLLVPYTFKDREHFWRFASSDVAIRILDEPYKNDSGLKGLFFTEEGFRHFFSTEYAGSIKDLKGKRIRSAGNTMMNNIIKAFGGEFVSISFSNLYSEMKIGKADMADQPIMNYLSNNFNQVAPYVILDGHQMGMREIVISSEVWDSLSKKQKNILLEASKTAQEYCKKYSAESEAEAIKILESEGTHFIEVENRAEWREFCADVINEGVRSQIELYGEIINLAD